MDKLYSKEQIEEWASKRADDAGRLSRQLLDTMRENERLRKLIEIGLNCIDRHDAIYKEGPWEMLAREELYPNKESDNG